MYCTLGGTFPSVAVALLHHSLSTEWNRQSRLYNSCAAYAYPPTKPKHKKKTKKHRGTRQRGTTPNELRFVQAHYAFY